jgi:hypothetical protein
VGFAVEENEPENGRILGAYMAFLGLGVALLGFLIAVASVGLGSSVAMRMGLTLLGIAVSLFGIFGMINPAFQKNAVWKK